GIAVMQLSEPEHEARKTMVENHPEKRPSSVPPDAVFRGGADGGYFVSLVLNPLSLANGQKLTAYEMGVYHSFSGDVEYKGNGIYIPPSEVSSNGNLHFLPPPSVDVILQTTYYSFGALE